MCNFNALLLLLLLFLSKTSTNNVKRKVQGKGGDKQQHTKAYSHIHKVMKKLGKVWSHNVQTSFKHYKPHSLIQRISGHENKKACKSTQSNHEVTLTAWLLSCFSLAILSINNLLHSNSIYAIDIYFLLRKIKIPQL